ncbi:MAG: hypothetical protein ACOCZ6_00655 [Nanoarchaeota archaeon]
MKNKQKLIEITLAEILHLLCLVSIVLTAGYLFSTLALDFQKISPDAKEIEEAIKEEMVLKGKIDESIEVIKKVFLQLVLGLVGFIVLTIGLTTLTKGFIYSRYSKKSYWDFLRSFAPVNVVWMTVWTGIFLISFRVFRTELFPFAFIGLIALYMILTPILRSVYTTHKGRLHKVFIDKGIKRFHRYLIPMLIAMVLGFLNLVIWLFIFIKPGVIFILINACFTIFIIILGRNLFVKAAGRLK